MVATSASLDAASAAGESLGGAEAVVHALLSSVVSVVPIPIPATHFRMKAAKCEQRQSAKVMHAAASTSLWLIITDVA